jgi:N6-L-threonylcarbamoyladenine synthase
MLAVQATSDILVSKLPRPMIDSGTFEFSFAGLKTAALYALRDDATILADEKKKAAFAREVENAILEVLISKTISAAKKFNPTTIMAGGGVVANKKLIAGLKEKITTELPGTVFTHPQPKHATDNAAMIAVAAFFNIQKNGLPKASSWKKIDANPNWRAA